jgi:hypothetical protein
MKRILKKEISYTESVLTTGEMKRDEERGEMDWVASSFPLLSFVLK